MKTKHIEYLRCELTEAEIADAARELARANARRAAIEQQKREVDTQLKGEIEAQNTVIGRLATLINNGAEFRNIECEVRLDTPSDGRKTIYRCDTGEEVAVKPMTDADRQMSLDLQAQAEAEATKEAAGSHVIVTPAPFPPPVVISIESVNPELSQEVAEQISEGEADDSAPLAPAATMGGTHQRKRRGKEAASGE